VADVFDFVEPQGAFYVFPRITAPHKDSRKYAIRLLEEAGVAVPPGSAFGPTGEGHVRMAFCVDADVINRASDQMERYFDGPKASPG
jgi:aminotransferase